MSSDTELKLKHDVLQIEKKKRPKRYVRNIFISFVPVLLSYLGIVYLNFSSLVIFFVLTLLGSILIFIIYTSSTLSRIWSPLKPMEKAFEAVYEALKRTWPTTSGTHEPSPDETFIKDYVHELLDNASQQLGEVGAEEALSDEIDDLLAQTQKNIEDRLIPALDSGKLSRETLTELGKVFASPSFESLRNINSTIEKLHEGPREEKTESTIERQLLELRRRGIVGLLLSIVVGFGTAGLILPVIGLFLQEDLVTFIRSQAGALVVAGAALSALYSRIFLKRGEEQ